MQVRFSGAARAVRFMLAVSAAILMGVFVTSITALPGATAQTGTAGAESLSQDIQAHIDAAQVLLDQILAVEGERTVENTLETMNRMAIELDAAGAKSSLFENVHPDADVRTAAEKGSQDVSAFVTELSLNRDVYDALAAVDVSGADAITQRLHEHSLRDYRRAGVDKDDATREKIRSLREELVEIGQEFDRNIREGVRNIELDSVDDLAGLPQDYIEAHEPDENGKITITTRYPDYIPFMTYAKNGEARQKLYLEYNNRAYPENQEVFSRLLEKRYELARTLGYENWADYITDDKMIGSPENVADFLQQLDDAARPRADHDYGVLLERKRQDDPSATNVGDFEKSYYSELVKKEQFDFDSQLLRDYYPYEQVKEGILDMTAKLFNVRYEPVTDVAVWHESVDCYDLYEDGERIGRFFLDMHPRDGKYGHAAQFTLNTGVKDVQIPQSVLVCNFPGGGDGPGLMEHDDVETFLHEFGHLLHSLFGGHQKWINFSGVATEWDFVEAPSQMLEEWSLDAKTLQNFARHYETGEPIPAELVERLKSARDFGNGLYVTQQNYYSSISLYAYNQKPGNVNMNELVPELQAKYSSFDYLPGAHMYASFGHLEGYSAMYYTYMWSLVIAKDLFSKFDQTNLMDPGVATQYRKAVLDPGGTRDAADLVKEFLGREYSFESFKAWINRGAM